MSIHSFRSYIPTLTLSFPLIVPSSFFFYPCCSIRFLFFFFLRFRRPPRSTLFPYPPLFRSRHHRRRSVSAVREAGKLSHAHWHHGGRQGALRRHEIRLRVSPPPARRHRRHHPHQPAR